ncbi:DUF1361 domain-containing protein [Cohnella faecalis]|uniref:DUF1361 domain-containing protein n=1 Tax=Cohnella faecalis TaxID=2315694 RepID=A0A398CIS9_9BACL|nr:DUF1361 domain-containing protein [Cohnella faecalis]RIE00768.1 DUF1361 domain-containing protein [Cohnella faecalis]
MTDSRSAHKYNPVVTPMVTVLLALTAVCFCLVVLRAFRVERDEYGFLLWNLFLAWLPLVVSIAAILYSRLAPKRLLTPGLVILGIAWLLLFPNAPYLTTDFIHLLFGGRLFTSFNSIGLLFWFDLIVYFLFAWCGLLLGYLSMRHFQAIVQRYSSLAVGWAFVIAASFLGGFGVYLGRVVRLNSWDAVFSPFRLIEGVIEGLTPDAAVFTFMFGFFIFGIYVSLYALQRDRSGS